MHIQLAGLEHIAEICALDGIARQSAERWEFIRHAVETGECYIAIADGVAGYAVLEYSFFGQGFAALLVVKEDRRRQGVGAALMRHLEAQCRTPKLFTSTNLSNLPMQALLARLGYRLSGVIHDLDEGDPELVYVKYLR